MANVIDSLNFDGTIEGIFTLPYGTCATAAATVAKVATATNFVLETGARIAIKFTYANSAASPTLNVNSSGAKAIYWHGAALASSQYWQAGAILDFVYNGTQWELIGIAKDNNTTYSAAGSALGLVKTGGDVTISDGIITVKDDSHNHTIANVDNLQTTLDDKAPKSHGIHYIEGTGDTAGTWLGTHDDITEYYAGLVLAYKIGVAGLSSGTTLNINNLGAVTVVKNATSAISTNFAVNSVIFLVYTIDSSGTAYWKAHDYDNNTKTTTGTSNKASTKLFLAGATSQASSATTYSNSKVYIGTDNCLYSNNAKVATSAEVTAVSNLVGDTAVATQIDNAIDAAANKSWALVGGTPISENTDLHTLTTEGNYYCSENTTAETLINSPTTRAFTMKVYSATGPENTIQWRYIRVELRPISGNDGLVWYTSAASDDSGATWQWTAWECPMPQSGGTFTGEITLPPGIAVKLLSGDGGCYRLTTSSSGNLHLAQYDANGTYLRAIFRLDLATGTIGDSLLMPKSGGTFTGNVTANDTNRAGRYIRGNEVKNSAGTTQVSTNCIVFVRK